MISRVSILAAVLALFACSEGLEPEAPAASSGGEVAPPATGEAIAPPTEAPAVVATPDPAPVPVGTPAPPEVAAPAAADAPQPSAAGGANLVAAAAPAADAPADGPSAAPAAAAQTAAAAAPPPKAAAAPRLAPAPAKPAAAAPSAPAASARPAHPQPSVAAAAPAAPAANAPGKVIVDIAKLESDDGKIQAALFRGEAGFPDEPAKAAMRKLAKIKNRRADLIFDGVPPGEFAVLVHHDENGDSKMQTGLFGQPAEGYAISRDAPANFGPPSYEDARLILKPGETKRVVVKMRY